MKFLLLAATVALAAAKADPWVYSTGLVGAPLTYGLPYAPVVYTAAAGCQNDAGAVVPCAHGGLVGVVPAAAPADAPAVESERKKREAEATAEAEASPEAEADPYLLYGAYGHGLYGGYYGYGYHGYGGWHGLGYALGGCRNYLGGLVPCAGR